MTIQRTRLNHCWENMLLNLWLQMSMSGPIIKQLNMKRSTWHITSKVICMRYWGMFILIYLLLLEHISSCVIAWKQNLCSWMSKIILLCFLYIFGVNAMIKHFSLYLIDWASRRNEVLPAIAPKFLDLFY